MTPLHLLVLQRDPTRREELLGALRGAGHHASVAPDAPTAAMVIGVPGFDTLVLDLGHPDLDLGGLRQALTPTEPTEPETLAAAERRHIALTLRHTAGNKRQAALLLGISRSTLLNKVRKYGLLLALALVSPETRMGTGFPLNLEDHEIARLHQDDGRARGHEIRPLIKMIDLL